MKTIFQSKHLSAAMALACGILFVKAAEMRFPLPPETPKLKPGSGSGLVTAQCLLCHSADYVSTQPKLSRAAWQAVVLKMQQKYGAPIQTNAVDALVEYLAKNYGAESVGK